MTLPKTKTWLISPNNSVATNGANNNDYYNRIKDIADVLGTIVSQLISLAPASVHLVSSSDGVSNVNPANFSDSTNYWVSGSSSFRNTVVTHVNTAYSNPNALWAIIQFPTGQLCLSINITGISSNVSQFQAYWTTGTFSVPTDQYSRPTASPEYKVSQWQINSNYGGIFNQDNLGIVNVGCNYTNYTHKVHVGLANDYSSFYAVSFRSYIPDFAISFSDLTNPVTNWDVAKVMFTSGNLSVKQLIGPYYDSFGYQIRASLDTSGVKAVIPCIGNSDSQSNGSNYQLIAANPVIFNAIADNDTGNFPFYPVGIYSPTNHGIKGSLSDIWWGASNGNANTYPSTGAVEYIQANDLVFPWSGASVPEFT